MVKWDLSETKQTSRKLSAFYALSTWTSPYFSDLMDGLIKACQVYIYCFFPSCACFPKRNSNSPSASMWLRAYPVGMALRLEELYRAWKDEPRCDLRTKCQLNFALTDREMFEQYPMGDLYMDGFLHECFFYMYDHSALQIPESWAETMKKFHKELKDSVP